MATLLKEPLQALSHALGQIIYGKQAVTEHALCGLLAGGHLLLEDLPGMGKTTLAQGLAKVFGLDYQRVQFTSDLLPADVTGSTIYQQTTGEFTFHKGPVFTQVLLADEINRASPKTQSALLEAMGERQVTADGHTYDLPSPFFVIATQNPQHQSGTFPLPESQLDRFMMRLSLGYPTEKAERLLLKQGGTQSLVKATKAIISFEQLQRLQTAVKNIEVSDNVIDYLHRLLTQSRHDQSFDNGLSPRAGLAWLHCAKAWALLQQRDYLTPDDLQAVMLPVIGHRLLPMDSIDSAALKIETFMKTVPVVR
ncbi:AAA family ATPase [Eionea flava]